MSIHRRADRTGIARSSAAFLGVAAAVGLLFTGASAALAQSGEVEIFANPSTVAVGQATTVSATGLGGLQTAGFGLDNTQGGSLSADASTFGPSAEVPVNDGSATVTFKATEPGTYTVDVTDGETPLGQTTITVTGSAPSAGAQLTASPTSVSTGASATITATGLGGLQNAQFGLGDGPSGASLEPAQSNVSAGTATTTFTATQPGTYTVDVTDGETPLATVEVTVTAAAPTPAPTTVAPTPTPTPTSAPNQSGVPAALVWTALTVGVLLLAAAITTAIILARRRNNSRQTGDGRTTRG